jgi:hypothetical protein
MSTKIDQIEAEAEATSELASIGDRQHRDLDARIGCNRIIASSHRPKRWIGLALIEHTPVAKHVVDQQQSAAAQSNQDFFVVVMLVDFVRVDKADVEERLSRKRPKGLERRSDA